MKALQTGMAWAAMGLLLAGCGGGGGSGRASAELPERPANAECVADAVTGTGPVRTVRAFPGINLGDIVTGLYQAPQDDTRWYATVRSGDLVWFENRASVTSLSSITGEPAVDARGEGGLLSMAFHPNFGRDGNRYVYLSYTASEGGEMVSRITRYVLGTDDVLRSPLQILELPQPETNHNGGNIGFGPDGYLYVGFGDGGGSGDPHRNGQNPQTFHSKILRIDVDGGTPYRVPSSNPFYNSSTHLPEIYAQGFRNPWRWSFDRANGQLFVADVGHRRWEEVNAVDAGGNYGWPITEGNHCYSGSTCNTAGLTAPIYEYGHDAGCSITGGFVYRGNAIPELRGRFVFGDYCMSGVHSFLPANPAQTHTSIAASGEAPNAITTFGEANDGELLIGTAGGALYRFVRVEAASTPEVPQTLSEHPCFSDASRQQLSSGVIPYSVNSPLWSDGADKQRFVALPDGQTIGVDARGDMTFPVGSVLIKHFLHDNRMIETRFLMHHADGWAGYSYEWNEAGTDATLSTSAHTRVIDSNYTHIFPSSAQCFQCHTRAANIALGPETAQLNRNHVYANGVAGHQLDSWQRVGLLAAPLTSDQRHRSLVPLEDTAAPVEQRVRAYLHSNCSSCHQPGAFPTHVDLRYDTPFNQTGLCNAEPVAGDLGIADARILAPGSADRSVLYQRMARRDEHRMPPLASAVVDQAALAVISEWINGMSDCAP